MGIHIMCIVLSCQTLLLITFFSEQGVGCAPFKTGFWSKRSKFYKSRLRLG